MGALILLGLSPGSTRALVQVLFAAFTFAIGFIFPVWFDWVAGLFGREIRGRAFGWSGAISAVRTP